MIWVDAADIDPFENIGTASDSEGAIGMDLFNCEWADLTGFKFGGVLNSNEDFVSRLVVVEATAKIFLAKILINQGLTFGSDGGQISDDGNREQHVTAKGPGSRGNSKSFLQG